jgi:hypothetical protein
VGSRRVLSLLSTLAVEAAVHHLDLVASLDRPGPPPEALAEVRRVLEGLHGGPLPRAWDDADRAVPRVVGGALPAVRLRHGGPPDRTAGTSRPRPP